MENWPESLHRLAIPSYHIQITLDQVKRLGSNVSEYGACAEEVFGIPPYSDIKDIVQDINSFVEKCKFDLFIRLGSRSPKDSYFGYKHGFKISPKHPQKALQLLLDSERVFEDLELAVHNNYQPYIVLRQWVDIPQWSEFRSFVKDKKLVGISQYFYRDYLPEIEKRKGEILKAIEEFFCRFISISHLDTVVFDLYLIETDEGKLTARLIEINPFLTGPFGTDPCLFANPKNRGFDYIAELDGSFRYIREPVQKEEEQFDDWEGI